MVQHGPVVVASSDLGSGEDNGVERNIVLTHELVKLDIVLSSPPLLPVLGVVGGDGNISDTSIEPDVENLLLVSGKRNGGTPGEVTSDTTLLQSLLQPRLGDDFSVLGPLSILSRLGAPLLNLALQLVELQEDVARVALNGGVSIELATGVNKLKGVKKLSTSITLVSTGILVATLGASSLDETVGKETLVVLTVKLGHGLLNQESVVLELHEDILGNNGLLLSRSTSKVVESNIEPLVDTLVKVIVLVAKLTGSASFLKSFGLSCGSVLVSSTNVESVVVASLAVSCESVGTENGSDDVTQVRDVVYVGQGRGDKNVLLARYGKTAPTLVLYPHREKARETHISSPSLGIFI
jgi:hypothetical protein